MEQCRGGCSHEMVMSPATATTMVYPTEEEKRSHRRIGDVNGDDNNEDDDVVRGNGNREERSRDLAVCRVCDFKSDRNLNDPELCSSDHSNGSSKKAVTDTSNSDFICSDQPWQLFNGVANTEESAPNPSADERQDMRTQVEVNYFSFLSKFFALMQNNEKENQETYNTPHKRRRKQSQPKQVICQWDSRKRYVIPVLRLQNIKDIVLNKQRTSSTVDNFFEHRQSTLRQPRTFKCHMCPKYAPARGINHRPYHSRASLMLHTLWRHKRRSWLAKTHVSKITLPSIVSSITLKATFFTRPNYSYHR